MNSEILSHFKSPDEMSDTELAYMADYERSCGNPDGFFGRVNREREALREAEAASALRAAELAMTPIFPEFQEQFQEQFQQLEKENAHV